MFSCSAETDADSSGEGPGQAAGDQEGRRASADGVRSPCANRVLNLRPATGVPASDEPDPVLRGGEQEASGAGSPAGGRTAPPAAHRAVRPAAAGTPGHQE